MTSNNKTNMITNHKPFDKIKTRFEAYFVGMVMTTPISKTGGPVQVTFNITESIFFNTIKRNLQFTSFNVGRRENTLILIITDVAVSNNILFHVMMYNKLYTLPPLNPSILHDYVRGMFDSWGTFGKCSNGRPNCKFDNSKNDTFPFEELKRFSGMPCLITEKDITWNGVSALDFMGKLYMGSNIHLASNYSKFVSMVQWTPSSLPSFEYSTTHKDAVAPSKSRISDSGYDLHLVKKIKEVNGVHYYDTCIQVKPEVGYYFDLVGRSSISKTGWMVANNVGIIDMSYRGSIIVALVPSVEKPKAIVLPCKLVQIIPRKVIIMDNPRKVANIDTTDRGESGGLGSGQFK